MKQNIDIAVYVKDELTLEESRLTLYPDENINLNQSVQSLKDLTKVFTDFTRSFSVPADDNNNAIFKHYYDAQVVNGFDARKKIDGRIEIGGVTLKKGKIQLNDAMLKSNVPTDYKLEFFGDTVKINDLIGDDTLRDLDYTSLTHDYTDDNVLLGLKGELLSGVIKYPLISYDRRFLWQDIQEDTPTTVNIKYDDTFTSGLNFSDLKPIIKVDYILNAITSEYGIVFSDEFFAQQEWQQLYMSLSNGKQNIAPNNQSIFFDFSTVIFERVGYSDFVSAISDVTISNAVFNQPYRLVVYLDGVQVFRTSELTNTDVTIRYILNTENFREYNFEYRIESIDSFAADITIDYFERFYDTSFNVVDFNQQQFTINGFVNTPPQIFVSNYIADIKIVEWFAAIIKAFNLVLVPQEDGSLYVNTLSSWYDSGDIIDVSEYADIETLEVARGKLYRDIDFGYEEQKSILANEYESQFGQQFGGFESQIQGLASDSKLEIKLPFENPQFERLQPSINQYGYIVDKDLNEYDNKPFLLYAPVLNLPNDSAIGFTGDTYTKQTKIAMPSHSIMINGGFAAQFNAEFSEYTGNVLDDNWYSRYYSDYINDLFNAQRREFTLNINFPITLASNLRLNDRLIIKGNRYIIDNLNTNLLTGVSKAVLLNDIFTSLSASDVSKVSKSFVMAESSGSVFYTGAKFAQVTTDSSFITLEKEIITSGENINFTLSANKTGMDRIGIINIFDGLQNPSITIFQTAESLITFDSTIITFDNNMITF